MSLNWLGTDLDAICIGACSTLFAHDPPLPKPRFSLPSQAPQHHPGKPERSHSSPLLTVYTLYVKFLFKIYLFISLVLNLFDCSNNIFLTETGNVAIDNLKVQ